MIMGRSLYKSEPERKNLGGSFDKSEVGRICSKAEL